MRASPFRHAMTGTIFDLASIRIGFMRGTGKRPLRLPRNHPVARSYRTPSESNLPLN